MEATARVQNSNLKTVGFIINESYTPYYNVLKNIDLIDNLVVDMNGVIQSRGEQLPVLEVRAINRNRYRELCTNNSLIRDVQTELKKWQQKWSQYVLYLTGARQIGKTTELLKFAYANYEQIVYINLSNEESLQNFERLVLSNSFEFGMINYCKEARLEEFCNTESTLLIIDEIQESYKIYNSIRVMQGELKCHVAVTGSYLGKTLNSKFFKPAGNMYEIEMLPLSFSEFCRAFCMEEKLYDVNLYGKSEDEIYKGLTGFYEIYKQIGGYPAVVTQYKKTSSIEDCFEVIRSIIDRFTEESAAYFEDAKGQIVFQNVYKAAFIAMTKEKKGTSSQDVKDITEFIKSDTKENVSRAEVNKVISWLKYSKIIGSCDLYNQGAVSDLLNERRFYFMDCGIANYIAYTTSMVNSAIEGILSENFAYTELYRLYKTDKVKGNVPCCSVYNQYEVDFMIVDREDNKYGIEIKTSKASKTESLNVYIKKKFIDEAYLAERTRGGIREKIRSIPIYTVGCRFPYRE